MLEKLSHSRNVFRGSKMLSNRLWLMEPFRLSQSNLFHKIISLIDMDNYVAVMTNRKKKVDSWSFTPLLLLTLQYSNISIGLYYCHQENHNNIWAWIHVVAKLRSCEWNLSGTIFLFSVFPPMHFPHHGNVNNVYQVSPGAIMHWNISLQVSHCVALLGVEHGSNV